MSSSKNGMSFRRRRALALRPVTGRKNIVQNVAIIAAAATGDFDISLAVDQADLGTTNEVTTGARINTIYLEIWMMGNAVEGVNSPITWSLAKNPAGQLTLPVPSSAGANANKKWIFAMGKGLVGSQINGQPGYLIRGWFKIPSRYRRMGISDEITLKVENNTANDLNICRLAIYKWYV